jgi:hypothetical protein
VQQEQSNFTIMYRASSNHKSAVNSRGWGVCTFMWCMHGWKC